MARSIEKREDASDRELEKIFTYLERAAVKKGVITKKLVESWHKKGYWTSYATLEDVLVKAYVDTIKAPGWDGSL